MAKRKAAGQTARQMEALRARVDKRLTIAEAESATGIAGWRLASVLLEALVSRGQLTVNEVVAIIIGAREGIWSELPNARIAGMLLDLELADWQSRRATKH
jgi:hypothetical protein